MAFDATGRLLGIMLFIREAAGRDGNARKTGKNPDSPLRIGVVFLKPLVLFFPRLPAESDLPAGYGFCSFCQSAI